MLIILAIALFVAALILIVKGGDSFVDAASTLSERTGIPKIIVGATVVSFATTMPELLVSVTATVKGVSDMGVGNAIGSVAFNTGVILGLSAGVLPAKIKRRAFLDKGLLMIASGITLLYFISDQRLSVTESFVLLSLLAIFFYLNIVSMVGRKNEPAPQSISDWTLGEALFTLIKFAGGALAIVFGARMLVENGAILARALGVPDSIIGLTLVAVGTSLPELVTTLSAIAKKEPALSIGNIIGANTIAITMILPTCALISQQGLAINARAYLLDLPLALALMVVAIIPPALTGKFMRWQGIILLLLYTGYLRYIMVL